MILPVVERVFQTVGRRVGPILLGAALLGAALTGWLPALLLAVAVLAANIAFVVLDVRRGQLALHELGKRLRDVELTSERSIATLAGELERTRVLLASAMHELAEARDIPPAKRVPAELGWEAVRALMRQGRVLDAYAVASGAGALTELSMAALRRLRDGLHHRGYLNRALEVARVLEQSGPDDDDRRLQRHLEGEIAVLSGGIDFDMGPADAEFEPRHGRILHLVHKSLPGYKTGYAVRTHYVVMAQQDAGLDPHVATQMAVSNHGSGFVEDRIDGITYHRIPGPRRSQEPLDVWLGEHIRKVAELVRTLQPAVLHAASDHVNAQTATVLGRAFGIPVVYESRGFWEETWLSRATRQFGWDLSQLEATHGLPDAYLWRRDLEDRLRQEADRVVTLGEVMAERIESGGVPRGRITVVPNGVAVEAFPVVTRDLQLAAALGIDEDTTVIGYISSLVEYEGIDGLISAFAAVRESFPRPVALLIVGDGPSRDQLMEHARSLGVEDVVFTGRIPHDTILGYYSLIDIFVVPRRPAEVSHLVTPLKPFEAFSTGRTVVMSNVRALAAIAVESGAAELFDAGDPQSLAAVLVELLQDPGRRRKLADRGAEWVRTARTWKATTHAYLRLYQEMEVVRTDAVTAA